MGLIELFEKSKDSAESRDVLTVKLITVRKYDDESLIAFFEQFYPDQTERKVFFKNNFESIYPIYHSPVLSTIFGMTTSAIRKIASRKNVKKAQYWTSGEDDFLLKNYKVKSNKELQK